ncbi:MAG: HAD-IA family hydrolase [Acidihalobacter sp.]|jgi:HAD superfamily hydrolase (TIGR01509 family)|uniref:HAD-IA family hydrolase n=1 Tax=Acidihalobacter sp. TaxID=1872108 RepID=UPI00307F757F
MDSTLVIFDLDGTLVDSERLGGQALLELLPELDEPLEELVVRYRGRRMHETLSDIERRIERPLGADFEARFRDRMSELFVTDLRPMPGVPQMLDVLALSRCIASNSPPDKIELALKVTELGVHFGPGRFSAYDVGAWKPDPGLFLHAAASMGFVPRQCVVVEDTPVGLAAAEAAGMRALHYVPGGDADEANGRFSHMNELPSILESMRR